MPIFNNQLAGAAGSGGASYEIEHSLRFNPGDSPQLKRDFTEAGNRRTWTFSCWVKRTTSFNSYRHTLASGPGTTLSFSESAQGGSDSFFFYVDGTPYLLSDEVARDTAAWYHVVFVFDTTNATAADRCRIYKNGVRITSFRNTAYPAQNFEGSFNTAGTHKIGYGNANEVLDGYLADVHFLDGQTPGTATDDSSGSVTGTPNAEYLTDFGEFDDDTGAWNPIKYTGTYGQNGFKLVFDPAEGFGDDTNGGMTTLVTTSNITAVSTSTVSLGGSSTGNTSTSQSEVANAFDNNTSTFFGFSGGGCSPDQIKEWTFSTGLPVKAGDVVSYEGSKGAGFKAGVFLANGQVVGGNYPYPNVDSVTASSDTTITKINAGCFGGGAQYSNIKKLTINGVAYPLSATELTLTDTTGLSDLSTGHEIVQTGGTATGTIYRIDGTTVDLTQTTNTWSTGSTANKPSLPITNDFTATNLTTSVQSIQSSPITAVATVNTWNQDKVWSNEVSGPRQGSNPWSNAFDGSINSNVDVNGSTSLNQSFTGVTSFRFATVINQPVTISGTGITTQTWSTAGWKTVTLTSSSISNIVVSPGPGETMTYPSAFEVNGEILVDQGVSGNQVVSNTLTLTDTTNLDALSVGDVVYPGNKQITAINTSTPSIVVNGGAFQVGGVVSKLGTFGDDVIDTPTNVEQLTGNPIGNYATLNSAPPHGLTLINGNLDGSGSVIQGHAPTTIYTPSGKFYCEFKLTTYQNDTGVGVVASIADPAADWLGEQAYTVGYLADGRVFQSGSATNYSSYAAGDIIGVAFDAATGKVWFHKNGVYLNSGDPAAGTGQVKTISGDYALGFAFRSVGGAGSFNFGQRGSFDFAVPTGFKALCTENLDNPLIEDSSTAFQTKLWTGNQSTRSITTTGMSPNFVWIKGRNNQTWHELFDSVRGPLKQLYSNEANAEATTAGTLTAFNTDGFSLGSNNGVNGSSSRTYVGWAWDGGDLVTNSAYNQDRVWSDGVTFSGSIIAPATNAFDGNSATSASPYDGANGGGTPQWVQVTFNPGISYTSSVKVERQNGNPSNVTVAMNGGTPITSAFQAYTTVATGSGTLTSIKVQNNGSSNTAGISRIEVDGKVLVDKGVIPVGSLNSSVYDSSQTWSSFGSSGTYSSTYDWTKMFAGDMANARTIPADGQSITADFSSLSGGGIAYTSSFKLFYNRNSSAPDVKVNGSGINATADGTDRVYELTGSGLITSVGTAQRQALGNGDCSLKKIEIDGKILLDSGVTPVDNFPSIASTVCANPTAGFSIATYSQGAAGSVVAHGLNKKPEMIIAKKRNGSDQPWVVYHSALGKGGVLQLHVTDQNNTTYPTYWGNNEPDSNVFGLYTASAPWANNSGNMVAYCISPVDGYSAVGSYTGNGSSDGPFVHTGHKVAFLMIKRHNSSGAWVIVDNRRDGYNETYKWLEPDTATVEQSVTPVANVDFLSNGFKLRGNGATTNASGGEYIYWAVAENPFKTARAR